MQKNVVRVNWDALVFVALLLFFLLTMLQGSDFHSCSSDSDANPERTTQRATMEKGGTCLLLQWSSVTFAFHFYVVSGLQRLTDEDTHVKFAARDPSCLLLGQA